MEYTLTCVLQLAKVKSFFEQKNKSISARSDTVFMRHVLLHML